MPVLLSCQAACKQEAPRPLWRSMDDQLGASWESGDREGTYACPGSWDTCRSSRGPDLGGLENSCSGDTAKQTVVNCCPSGCACCSRSAWCQTSTGSSAHWWSEAGPEFFLKRFAYNHLGHDNFKLAGHTAAGLCSTKIGTCHSVSDSDMGHSLLLYCAWCSTIAGTRTCP